MSNLSKDVEQPIAAVAAVTIPSPWGVTSPSRVAERRLQPPTDVLEDPRETIVFSDLPGMDPEEINVSIERGTLNISGRRRFSKSCDGFVRLDRCPAHYAVSVPLAPGFEGDQARASYSDGVLEVHIPRMAHRPSNLAVVQVPVR